MIDLKCKICGKECKNKNGLFVHLSMKHNLSTQEYYDQFYFKDGDDICQMGGCNNKTQFNKPKFKYNNTCKKCNTTIYSLERFILYNEDEELGAKLYNEYHKTLKECHTLPYYIEKYGEEKGTRLYNEKNRRIAKGNTLEWYIETYGKVEGTKRYYEKIEKNKNTEENFIKRHGYKEGKRKYEEYCKKCGRSEEFFIKNSKSDEEGRNKYYLMCEKRKKSHTKEELIKKHGEEWYDKRIEQLSYINTLPYYIEKHGKEEGTRLYNEKNKRIGRGNTLDWYKENYENKEDAVYFYLKKYKKSLNKASKESMNVFWPLIDWLFEKNICEFKDIYLGIPESHEYFLNAKKQLNRFYKYDFTIPKFNIIIEYNGEAFHPNPKWLKDAFDKWKNWQNHFNFKSANDIYIENLQKLNFARNKGFTVLELWSSDSVEVNINKCKENILQNCK